MIRIIAMFWLSCIFFPLKLFLTAKLEFESIWSISILSVIMSHLVYVHAHINYLLFSSCFLLNFLLIIYVRIHNLTATLKLRIDIDRIDANSNFAVSYIFIFENNKKSKPKIIRLCNQHYYYCCQTIFISSFSNILWIPVIIIGVQQKVYPTNKFIKNQ